MLYVNLFADGDALLECDPQGDASIPLQLPQADAEALALLLISPEVSAALARLFLAGVARRQTIPPRATRKPEPAQLPA